jgi:hypothetical protein
LDQGGDLYESHKFKEIALKHNFNLEPTGAGAPFQNGMVERVNQTLENMMRCLLLSANLGPEYWSFALTHAVYLKNRLPHTATGETPHLSYTGHKPNAKHLRIFGSPVFVKNPGRRPCKLDLHTATGKFLGCTATEKYIIYIDDTTNRIKIATHCVFDEAGITLPPTEQSPTQKALQAAGYHNENTDETEDTNDAEDTTDQLIVKLLSENARKPHRSARGSGIQCF